MILIGYSGHAFAVYGILKAGGKEVTGYCDVQEKELNPFGLEWYGAEDSDRAVAALKSNDFFIAIGDNNIRNKIYDKLLQRSLSPSNAIHPTAVIDPSVKIAGHGVMIAANATLNPLASVGTGAICNTGSVIEHECVVGDFAHIGPGAVLCGNVRIGERTFVGANAVIRQGLTIGRGVMIGAGSVVIRDVPDNTTVVGVPAK